MGDLSITAADVLASDAKSTNQLTAGTTITQGEVVYNNGGSPNLLQLASASSSTSAIPAGIALNSGSAGQPIDYVIFDPGLIIGATLSEGDRLYLSQTPGKITTSSGDVAASSYLVVLGQCTTGGSATTAVVNFRPLTVNSATLAQL